MKAIVRHGYGSPDVLRCEEVAKPNPGADEVLIRVRAASVNPYDIHLMRGTPPVLRVTMGLRTPRPPGLGADAAGEVEAVGGNVTRFKPGDAVFGACREAFAEYACTAQSRLARKPDRVTFEQAASTPIAASTALQGLRDAGHIRAAQRVLVNGAAGGVGTFAVQIAKSYGADVTGVCSTRNVDMLHSLGADSVIDYTRQDFTLSGQRYDVIFDLVTNHSVREYRRVLDPKGIFIGVGVGPGGSILSLLARGFVVWPLASLMGSQKFAFFGAKIAAEDLSFLGDLMAAGKVTPVIDRRYGLDEAPEAIRYVEEGHARGKVVIDLGGADKPSEK
jgi:NADPH:quinone reductase-like Zn-dependent oxidoreductase